MAFLCMRPENPYGEELRAKFKAQTGYDHYLSSLPYADLDYECYKPFDDIIDENSHNLYIIESPFKFNENLQNSLMISNPGNTFWLDCLEEINKYYNENIKDKNHRKELDMILEFGGPRMIDRVHNKKNYKEEVKILSVIPFFKGPRARHWQAGTWGIKTLKEMKRFPFNGPLNALIIIIILVVSAMIFFFVKR